MALGASEEGQEGVVEALWAEVRRLESRIRTLEGRLSERGITLSNTKGSTRQVRLADDESVEVV